MNWSDGNDGFGLQSDVDDDVVLADFDDQAIEDGAGTNPLARDALFKQFRKTFCHVLSVRVALASILVHQGLPNITAIAP